MWGVSMAAFSIVVAALLLYTGRWVPPEECKSYAFLLVILFAVYFGLCIVALVVPNETLWIIGGNMLLSCVTLYLIRLARTDKGTKEKLWLGVGLSIIMLCIFGCPAAGKIGETAVTVSAAFLGAHAAGLLELYLFGEGTAAHSDKTQS